MYAFAYTAKILGVCISSSTTKCILPSSAGDMKHSLHCFLEYALECEHSKAYSLSNINYVSD